MDRTNGGQFALGLKFLSTSLRALGLMNKTPIEPTHRIFLELMEMYGELGDRIAVQYGGSEAHNKMSTGASAAEGATSSSSSNSSSKAKQGELLTSIKRYYSNAFTDMVKQGSFLRRYLLF